MFSTQEHYGTHLDAPAHFADGAWTVDQIPAEHLVRPLVIIDVRGQVKDDPDYEVTVEDIAAWEDAHGMIPSGAVVMAYTGWDERWNSQKSFRNEQADHLTHYPGFSLEAAKFLVKTREVVGLGIDTMSVDIGATESYPVHLFTSRENVYHLENVANLALVPAAGATVVVAPIKAGKRVRWASEGVGVGEVKTAFRSSLFAFSFCQSQRHCLVLKPIAKSQRSANSGFTSHAPCTASN